ncbi:MAG TPA: hypothetical protein VH723_09725 [Candidatus Limnocylindrales bacterium]
MSEDATFAVTRVGRGRRSRIGLAVWLAVLGAIAAWLGAARIATGPRDEAIGALPAGAAQRSGPASTPVGPRPTGTVWLRSGSDLRGLDLRTGDVGRAIGTHDWRDKVLRLPNGTFICVCTEVTRVEGGEVVKVSLGRIDGQGVSDARELTTVRGRWDATRSTNDQSETVVTTAALSPNGRLLAVGLTVRGAETFERSLLVVDPARATVLQTIAVDPLKAVRGVGTWLTIGFSQNGSRILVSAAGYNQVAAVDDRHFVARIDGMTVGGLEPVPGIGLSGDRSDGRCLDAGPRLLDADTVVAICHGPAGTEGFVRKVDIPTGRMSELDLHESLQGAYPMQLLDERSSTLFLWDPFTHRAARVDLAAMRVEAATKIETPTAARSPLERLVRAASNWIAPAALAKILLEPGLALTADRLYVVAMSGDGFENPGEASLVLALDRTDLALLGRWSVEPDVVSIAIAPNGRDVVVGTLTRSASGSSEASVAVLDGSSGVVRARYDRLGSEWPLLVDDAAINR